MNSEVICSIVALVASICCALITSINTRNNTEHARVQEEQRKKEKLRSEESRLLLAMISANMSLTVAIAHSIASDNVTDEVDNGLAAVEAADKKYQEFVQDIANNYMNRGYM